MEKLLKILDFLNVLSDDKKLSITNLGLIMLITKMVIASSVDWPSVVAVIAAFGNYASKRVVNANARVASNEDKNVQ